MEYQSERNIIKPTATTKKRYLFLEGMYIALLGMIGFSRIGQHLLVNVLGLRFYLVELYFIPFFIYEGNNLKYYLKHGLKRVYGFSLIALIIIDILFGLIYTMDFVGIITMTRSILYIFISFIYFYEKKNFTLWKVLVLSLSSIFGEIIFALLIRTTSIASINTMCIALAIIISSMLNSYWLLGISSIFGLMISISSGYRIGIFVTILVLVEMIFWILLSHRKNMTLSGSIKRVSIPVIILIFSIIFVGNFNAIVDFVAEKFHMDAYAIYRVTNRLTAILRFDFTGAQEATRIEGSRLIFSSFFERLLPRGLVGKSIGRLGTYIDVPITYFYDVFGSLLTIPVLLSCIIRGYKSLLNSFKKETEDYNTCAGLMFPVFALYLIVNGNFLYITFQCILTGMIVGMWFSGTKPLIVLKARTTH